MSFPLLIRLLKPGVIYLLQITYTHIWIYHPSPPPFTVLAPPPPHPHPREHILIPWSATVDRFSGFVCLFVCSVKDQMNLAEEKDFFPGN